MLIWWSFLFNLLAVILAIVILPKGFKNPIVIISIVVFLILGIFTLMRSVKLRGLSAWIQARKKLGIIGIYRRGDERNKELSKHISSSKDLKIIAVSAVSSIMHFRQYITTALVENNCHIKVLIAKEESQFVKEVEDLEGTNRRGEISVEIEHTKSKLREIIDLAKIGCQGKSQTIGRIWIGQYDTALRNSLYICNNSWCWCTISLPPKRAMESVSLEIEQVNNGILRDCIDHFDAIWKILKSNRLIQEITSDETNI